MSDAAWFGLSHGRAWSDVGQSFCELADPRFSQLSSSPSPEAPLIAAGTRSSAKPKGAGSFQLQISQAARGKSSSFPKETYRTEFRTSKQEDFAADRLANVKAPVRAGRPKESETAALMRPGFLPETSAARPNKAQIQQESVSIPASTDIMGKTRLVANIRMPAFNIINGCEVAADKLKYCNGQQMDYRRRR